MKQFLMAGRRYGKTRAIWAAMEEAEEQRKKDRARPLIIDPRKEKSGSLVFNPFAAAVNAIRGVIRPANLTSKYRGVPERAKKVPIPWTFATPKPGKVKEKAFPGLGLIKRAVGCPQPPPRLADSSPWPCRAERRAMARTAASQIRAKATRAREIARREARTAEMQRRAEFHRRNERTGRFIQILRQNDRVASNSRIGLLG